MLVKSIAGAAICCAALSAALIFLSAVVADEPKEDEGALAKAARSAFGAAYSEYENNGTTAEDVYCWSKRLMEAELQAGGKGTVIADHLDRMRRLQELVSARHKEQLIGGTNLMYHAATYYVEEARLLQKNLKNSPPSGK